MNQNWIVFFVIACGLAAFAVCGTLLGAACSGSAISDTGETWGQCARGWIGSFGGWVAAIAAGITVRVLYRQIKSNEETVHKRANEAKGILKQTLNESFLQLNWIWKRIEDANRASAQMALFENTMTINMFCTAVGEIHRQLSQPRIAELLTQMTPLDHSRFSKIIELARYATEYPTNFPIDEKGTIGDLSPVPEQEYIAAVINRLQNFFSQLPEEASEVKEIFRNRSKQDFVSDPLARFNGFGWALAPNDDSNPY